ncbi:MAG: DUF2220 family protein [Clostridium sp.]
MENLHGIKSNYITLDEVIKIIKTENYTEIYSEICEMIDGKIIEPVRASKLNGKNPALYTKYRIIRNQEDNSGLIEEITYILSMDFDTSYYKNHLDKYSEHRESIILLNDFFMRKKKSLIDTISMNERSFQIWGKEKFLQKGYGKTILKNLGLSEEVLNFYDTSEPLAYYSISKEFPQKILIIENKDTYYTFRKHLINGNKTIFGEEIKTIVYGKGKNISKTFKDFVISTENYISYVNNEILYLGDIDYEGIVIYESFYKYFKNKYKVAPFVEGYLKMIDKALKLEIQLPITKEGQNRNIKEEFFASFNEEDKNRMLSILEKDRYIPQEIINIMDL